MTFNDIMIVNPFGKKEIRQASASIAKSPFESTFLELFDPTLAFSEQYHYFQLNLRASNKLSKDIKMRVKDTKIKP